MTAKIEKEKKEKIKQMSKRNSVQILLSSYSVSKEVDALRPSTSMIISGWVPTQTENMSIIALECSQSQENCTHELGQVLDKYAMLELD